MEFKEYVNITSEKLTALKSLLGKEELVINLDILSKENSTEQDLIYFNSQAGEIKGVFLFGFLYFSKEMEEQEFKKLLTNNSLNYKIINAYCKLKLTQNKIKISDILNYLQNKRKDSMAMHSYLDRIMSLAYYMNWKLERDKKDIENDFFIEIPENYLFKLKTRFNFDIISSVYEDKELFLFLNAKGILNLVFKNKNEFTRADIEKHVIPAIKIVFESKNIIIG